MCLSAWYKQNNSLGLVSGPQSRQEDRRSRCAASRTAKLVWREHYCCTSGVQSTKHSILPLAPLPTAATTRLPTQNKWQWREVLRRVLTTCVQGEWGEERPDTFNFYNGVEALSPTTTHNERTADAGLTKGMADICSRRIPVGVRQDTQIQRHSRF